MICGGLILAVLVRNYMGASQVAAHYRLANADRERRERWAKEAEPMMLAAAMNDCTGWRRTVSHTFHSDPDKEPTNWTGSVECECVNHIGGVDITNLSYHFSAWPTDAHVFVGQDGP
jgi:hypothetical protein